MRTLNQLVVTENSALPVLLEWARADDANPVEVRPPLKPLAAETLVEMQVTTASPLGAVAFHTGGLLFHDGFVRVLGSGAEGGLRSIRDWNRAAGVLELGYVLVADDVLGGFYAMNHGHFAAPREGGVFYLAPDQLEWSDLGGDYGDFLAWCFRGDFAAFYGQLGWEHWRDETRPGWNEAFAFSPLPWTAGGSDLTALSRERVPVSSLWRAKLDFMANVA